MVLYPHKIMVYPPYVEEHALRNIQRVLLIKIASLRELTVSTKSAGFRSNNWLLTQR